MSSRIEEISDFSSVYDPILAGSITGTYSSKPHDRALIRASKSKCMLSFETFFARFFDFFDFFDVLSVYWPSIDDGHSNILIFWIYEYVIIVLHSDRASSDPLICGDPFLTIFVGRLHPKTTEKTLHDFFSSFGEINHLRLVRDIATGESKRYAFISFFKKSDFVSAWKNAHQSIIDGSTIIVDYERERICEGWVPRREGGGLGGFKESGQIRFGGRARPFRTTPHRIPPKHKHRKIINYRMKENGGYKQPEHGNYK